MMRSILSFLAVITLSLTIVSAQELQQKPVDENKVHPELGSTKLQQITGKDVQIQKINPERQLSPHKAEVINGKNVPATTLGGANSGNERTNISTPGALPQKRSTENLTKTAPEKEASTLGARVGEAANKCAAKSKGCGSHKTSGKACCAGKKGETAKACCSHSSAKN